MREGWTETTLANVADFINGFPFKPSDLGVDGPPVIRIKQLLDGDSPPDHSSIRVPDNVLLRDGDVVFSWSGTLAVRIWNRGPALLNQHLFRVLPRTGVDRRWLAYALGYAVEELAMKTHGTTMKHITRADLLPHRVVLPPLAEQRRIVDLIASVDAAIEGTQVKVRSISDLSSVLINATFESPESEARPLRDYCEPNGVQIGPFGSQLHAADYVPEGVPTVMPKDIVNGHVDRASVSQVTSRKASQLARYRLAEGDILLPRRGDLTKRALMGGRESGWLCGTGTARIRPRRGVDPKTLYRAVSTNSASDWLVAHARGSTMLNLNTGTVERLPVYVPDNVSALVEAIDGADTTLSASRRSLRALAELRSVLLGELLSGSHAIPTAYDVLVRA